MLRTPRSRPADADTQRADSDQAMVRPAATSRVELTGLPVLAGQRAHLPRPGSVPAWRWSAGGLAAAQFLPPLPHRAPARDHRRGPAAAGRRRSRCGPSTTGRGASARCGWGSRCRRRGSRACWRSPSPGRAAAGGDRARPGAPGDTPARPSPSRRSRRARARRQPPSAPGSPGGEPRWPAPRWPCSPSGWQQPRAARVGAGGARAGSAGWRWRRSRSGGCGAWRRDGPRSVGRSALAALVGAVRVWASRWSCRRSAGWWRPADRARGGLCAGGTGSMNGRMARLYLVLFVLQIALAVAALISCLSADEGEINAIPRLWWILIILFFPLVGSIAWFVAGRTGRPAAQRHWRPGGGFPDGRALRRRPRWPRTTTRISCGRSSPSPRSATRTSPRADPAPPPQPSRGASGQVGRPRVRVVRVGQHVHQVRHARRRTPA